MDLYDDCCCHYGTTTARDSVPYGIGHVHMGLAGENEAVRRAVGRAPIAGRGVRILAMDGGGMKVGRALLLRHQVRTPILGSANIVKYVDSAALSRVPTAPLLRAAGAGDAADAVAAAGAHRPPHARAVRPGVRHFHRRHPRRRARRALRVAGRVRGDLQVRSSAPCAAPWSARL